jgi:uncharacterized membrane protein
MWSRQLLKDRAKATMKKCYWQLFVVALVLVFIGVSTPFSSNPNFKLNGSNSNTPRFSTNITETITSHMPNTNLFHYNGDFNFDSNDKIPFLPGFIGIAALGTVLFIVALFSIWRIFLGFPMEVGCRKFFLKATEDEQRYNQMTSFFNNETYWNIVKTMFMRGLYTFLWTLLLIVPGIIKGYAYSMVPYILSDNPQMDYSQAIQLSQEMTMGHKFDMFVLDLSFIGWYLLGALLCGLGGVFVNPYYHATHAELYLVLRNIAIEKGFCTGDQLNLADISETLF